MASKHEQLAEHFGHFLLSLRQGKPATKSRDTIAKLLQHSTHPDIQAFLLCELENVEHQHKALVGPIFHINRELQEHLCELQNDFDELEATQEHHAVENARLDRLCQRVKAENKLLYQENCELRDEIARHSRNFMRLRQKYERVVRKNDELIKTLVQTRNSLADYANGKRDSTAMAGGVVCGVLANLLSASVLKGL